MSHTELPLIVVSPLSINRRDRQRSAPSTEHTMAALPLTPADLFCLRHPEAPGWIQTHVQFPPQTADEIAHEARNSKYVLRPAAVGAGDARRLDLAHRGDSTAWLSNDYEAWKGGQRTGMSPGLSTIFSCLSSVESCLASSLAGSGTVLTGQSSVQLALYPGGLGARYVRHRDAMPQPGSSQPHRVFTIILYANPSDWRDEDGGQLRVWSNPAGWAEARQLPQCEPAPGEAATNITPCPGRVVVFRSTSVEHEVMPAVRDRAAVTMWLYGREDGLGARGTSLVPRTLTPSPPPHSVPQPAALLIDSFLGQAGQAGQGPFPTVHGPPRTLPPHLRDKIAGYMAMMRGGGAGGQTSSPVASPVMGESLPAAAQAREPAEPPAGGHPTIFVLVPCYRDPEAMHTVLDCLATAHVPGRISLGLVWQYELSGAVSPTAGPAVPSARDVALFSGWSQQDLARLPPNRTRHIVVDARAAGGPAWARSLGTGLYSGEDYVLCLDCHTRFVPGWDEVLVRTAGIAARHAARYEESETSASNGPSSGPVPEPPVILSSYPRGYGWDQEGRSVVPGRPRHTSQASQAEQASVVTPEGALTMIQGLRPMPAASADDADGKAKLLPLGLPQHLLPCVLQPSPPPAGPISPRDGLLRITGRTVYSVPSPLAQQWAQAGAEVHGPAVPPHSQASGRWDEASIHAMASYPAVPGCLVAAGYLFCPAWLWVRHLSPCLAGLRGCFFGEEAALAGQAARAGAVVYHPGINLLYHAWARARAGREVPGASWRDAAALGPGEAGPSGLAARRAWAGQEAGLGRERLRTVLQDVAGPGSALASCVGFPCGVYDVPLTPAPATDGGSGHGAGLPTLPAPCDAWPALPWQLPQGCFEAI